MSYIRLEKINKSFGPVHVLQDISIEIDKGKLVTLLGPSGCGKSTLLRCLSGLEQVDSGRIYIDDVDITDVSAKKRGIGMVFQQYSLFPNMTVEKNVAYGLKIQKMPSKTIEQKVAEILSIVGLSEKAKQYPMQLSGGQQQRVALARALVTEPKVLLLDEPLSAIDALLRRNLQIEIRRIQKRLNITTVFVTHDQDEAMVMSDTIFLLNAGIIEQSGAPVDIYANPKTKFAATFIGNYNIIPAVKFQQECGEKIECEDLAIRPELVGISDKPEKDEKTYSLKGKIVGNFAHGNIIRYTINCGSFEMNADVLYKSEELYPDGLEVFLNVSKDLIIRL